MNTRERFHSVMSFEPCDRLRVQDRLPADWSALTQEYKKRDFPLTLGTSGYFGSLRLLTGEMRLLTAYYDLPALVHEICDFLTGLYPFEVQAGMDIRKVQEQFPSLQILEGSTSGRSRQGSWPSTRNWTASCHTCSSEAAMYLTRPHHPPGCVVGELPVLPRAHRPLRNASPLPRPHQLAHTIERREYHDPHRH